jgi:hypothetical protein
MNAYDDPSHQVWSVACAMKRLACLLALLLFAPVSSFPQESGPRDMSEPAGTVCITSEFAVDIEYPNFFVSVLAHLAGIHTDRLKFVEWDIKRPSLCSFLLHLTDDDKHRWFEIASDSSFPSFVKLPLEDRTVLTTSALSFFMKALQFFRSTGTDTLQATFEYGRDTLGASVFHLSRSTDTSSLITTLSHLETWNKRTGEAYNSAEVVAVTQEGYTSFRNINIFLKKKEITMRLTALRTSVVRIKE